jgi:hypothetical protein
MPDANRERKYRLMKERRLHVSVAAQLDERTPEEVLAQVNATLRRRQLAEKRQPNE